MATARGPRTQSLRAQDVLVACKLFSLGDDDWTYLGISKEIYLSSSEVHEAVNRCRRSGLLLPSREISPDALCELLLAAPRIFYAIRGGRVQGTPTGCWATCLRDRFSDPGPVFVWPTINNVGRVGESLAPIYPSVPYAAGRDEIVHEIFALVDVLRVGNERCRERAVELLRARIWSRPRSK